MLSSAFQWMLQRELRERYPTFWALLGEVFGLFLSLTIYFFTAKALGAHYFEYLIIGETALFLPLALFQGLSRATKQAAGSGILESLLSFPIRPQKAVMLLGSSTLPLEAARVLVTLGVAVIFFGMRIDPWRGLFVLGLQLLALPAFMGLGLIAASALIRFGRGDSLLTYLGAGAAIVAGAYFPTQVLPETLRHWALYASPFSVLLEGSRQVLSPSSHPLGGPFRLVWTKTALSLLLWGAACLPLGYALLGLSFSDARKKASPLLFSR